MKKLKLLVFHPTIAPYRIDLFNSLSEEFDTRICLSYSNLRSQKFDYSRIEAQFKFKPKYLQKLFTLKNRVVCKGYWKELADFNPDIVLVSEFSIDAIATIIYKKLHRKKYKIISICDDSYNMLSQNNDFSRIHQYLRSLLVPQLNNLILVEPKSVDWYQNHFKKGFCFPIVSQDKRVRQEYAAAINESNGLISTHRLEGKHVFLFVGRLVALKNVTTLIQAFSKTKNRDSVLVIVGDGPERNSLEKQAQALDNDIIFTGRLEGTALYAWYNIASCFVLPSIQEAFGAVTNEAMLGGCKCLISNNAGSQSLVATGINGYTFDPKNTEELGNLIIKITEETPTVQKLDKIRPTMMLKDYEHYFGMLAKNINHL